MPKNEKKPTLEARLEAMCAEYGIVEKRPELRGITDDALGLADTSKSLAILILALEVRRASERIARAIAAHT